MSEVQNQKEINRLKALYQYNILDTLPENQFDEITQLASVITGTPIALISLVDKDRQWFKSKVGLDADQTPRDISFCQYTIQQNDIYEVDDSLQLDLFKKNPLVTSFPFIRFYAGAPLIDPDGYNVGTLCVIDTKPNHLNDQQKKALKLLSKSIINQFEIKKKNRQLKKNEELLNLIRELQEDFISDPVYKRKVFKKMLEGVLNLTNSEYGFVGEVLIKDGKPYLKTLSISDISWNQETKKFYEENEALGLEFYNLNTLFGYTIRTGKPLITNDAKNHPESSHSIPALHPILQKYLGLPILDGQNKIVGMIGLANGVNGYYESDVTFLQPLLSTFNSLIQAFKREDQKKEIDAERTKLTHRLLDAQSIAKIGNWEFSPITNELYWSQEHYKIFELEDTPADKLYQEYCNRLHPEDLKQLQVVIQDVIDNGNDLIYPHRAVFPDGRMKHLMGLGYAVRDNNGKVTLIKGTCQDISEMKRIEIILKEQQEVLKSKKQYLKAILNSTEYSIISTDLNGIIQEFNRGAEKLLGYDRSEVVGKVTPAIIHDVDEVVKRSKTLSEELGIAFEPGFDTFVIKAREKNVADLNEWTYIRKDKTRVPVLLSVTAIRDEQNTITGYLGIAKDITLEKEKIDQITKANHKIQKLFDISINSLLLGNFNGTIEKINDAFANTLGFTKEEILSSSLDKLIHPDDLQNTIAEIEKLSKGYLSINFKNRYITKDGDYRWLNWSASPDVTTGLIYATAQDITNEYNLQKYKEAEQNAINNSVLRAEYLPDGTVLSINENFRKLIGYEEKEILGYHHSKFLFIEDVSQHNLIWEKIKNAQSYNGEIRRRKKDGQEFWIKGAYVPVKDLNGQILKIIKIGYDISDMKLAIKNVEDYKYALDQVAIVAITDSIGIIKFANNKFCEISKYSREELMGKDHNILNSHYHNKSFFANLWRTISSGNVWHGEIRNRAKDGSFYWTDSTIIPFLDNAGNILQYVAIRMDITERKKMEERLQKSMEQLDQFAYVVSHDLKAPLRAISTLTSFLEEDLAGKLDEESTKNFQLIKNRSQRLEHLINDILNYSKIGRLDVQKETFELKDLVDEILADLDIPNNFEVKCDALPTLLIEKVYITQIFSNLLSNAIKYNNKAEGKIEIGFLKEFHRFHLWVKDNGPGIEKQYHQKIFQLFQTIDKNERPDSTGIGLSTVKKIVGILEGDISVESELGSSTTFRIILSNKYLM